MCCSAGCKSDKLDVAVQVSIIRQLAGAISTIHSYGVAARTLWPIHFSSIRVQLATAATSPRPTAAAAVWLAPLAHPHASGSLRAAALPECMAQADRLCAARAAEAASASQAVREAADVWQVGAIGVLLLAASGGGRRFWPCFTRARSMHALLRFAAAMGVPDDLLVAMHVRPAPPRSHCAACTALPGGCFLPRFYHGGVRVPSQEKNSHAFCARAVPAGDAWLAKTPAKS